jgi:hypothetical protein
MYTNVNFGCAGRVAPTDKMFSSENLTEDDHFGNVGVYGGAVLICILKKQDNLSQK